MAFLLLLGRTGRVEPGILGIPGIAATVLIRLECLRCSNCGRGIGPARWDPGKWSCCPCCGEPLVFDDEPQS